MSTLVQTMTTSFKVALMGGEFDFSSDTSQTFKLALYAGDDVNLDASTTAYTTTGEVSGTIEYGYRRGDGHLAHRAKGGAGQAQRF